MGPKRHFKKKAEQPVPLVDWENQASPFYTPHHKRWRMYCRNFVDKELLPYIEKWEKAGDVPREFYTKCADAGVYAASYDKSWGGTPFEGKKMDHFHRIVQCEEFSRCGSGGLATSVWVHEISVPAVMTFGNRMQRDIYRDVVSAKKLSALAISEPLAGSDVRNLRTKAVLDASGENYIVNGEKYWISGGVKADWFTTAVRTGGPGIKGISLFIIPRGPGITTSRIDLQGHSTSATAYVIFRDVKVPKKYLVGRLNQGWKPIVFNFNRERWGIGMGAVCLSRICVIEAVRYAKTRKTFGKALIDHQVIRHKIANMSKRVMACYGYMCLLAYAMDKDPLGFKDKSIPINVSFFKTEATQCMEFCAREASQIFGGRSYVRGGRGGRIERIYRDVRAYAIYGGSEEILLDLGMRMAKL